MYAGTILYINPCTLATEKKNLSSSPFHVQFSLKPQLASHFSSFHVFLDLVHLEHCPTAILSIPSPVQYPCCPCAALFFLRPPTQLGHSRLSYAHLSSNLNPSHSECMVHYQGSGHPTEQLL